MGRTIAVLAGVVSALMLGTLGVPLLAGPATGVADVGPAAPYLVYLNGRSAAALNAFDVSPLTSYRSFVLAEVTDFGRSRLEVAGFTLQPVSFDLTLDGWTFDPTVGLPAAPKSLGWESYPDGGEGYYLVQTIGPIKVEWRWQLEAAGAQVFWYQPNYAFLVRMTTEEKASVQALPFVRWVGEYQTMFRVRPELVDAQGLVDVKIIAFPGESVDPIIAFLNKAGHRRIGFLGQGPGILRTTQKDDLGVVKARVDAALLPDLARLRVVEYIEPYVPPQLDNANAQWILQTYIGAPPNRKLWNLGLQGQGQVIGVADTGVDFESEFARNNNTNWYGSGLDPGPGFGPGSVFNSTDLSRRKVVRYLPMSGIAAGMDPWTSGDPWAYQDSALVNDFTNCTQGHGTSTSLTAVGNDDPIGGSTNDGMASAAQLYMQDIGSVRPTQNCNNFPDDALIWIPDDYDDLFGPAGLVYYDPIAPVRIHSNSWGSQANEYDLEARLVDKFMWEHKDMLILFPAGNLAGEGTVSSPGTAKDAVTVGGADSPSQGGNPENLNAQSAKGPAFGGAGQPRIKPDVVSLYGGTTACSRNDRQDPDIHQCIGETSFGGTSYAVPTAAGMAALIRQYYQEGWYPSGAAVVSDQMADPSAALLKATLLASGDRLTGPTPTQAFSLANQWPNVAQGWGRVDADNVLFFTGDSKGLWVVDNQVGLLTGDTVEYQVNLGGGSLPMKAVLAWTDFPAAINAVPVLVNDLDLTVIDPEGVQFRGNVFDDGVRGESARPGRPRYPGAYDNSNPNEGVILGPTNLYLRTSTTPPPPTACTGINRNVDFGWGTTLTTASMTVAGTWYCWYGAAATADTNIPDGVWEIHLFSALNSGAGVLPPLVNVRVVEVDATGAILETYCDLTNLAWTALSENAFTCNPGARVQNTGNRLSLQVSKAGGDFNPVLRYNGAPFQGTNRADSRLVVPNVKPGVYTLRITAANVPVGPQPFALVVTGNVDLGYGQVFLDQAVYGPASTVTITVEDANAVGPSVDVTISSDFEPLGETVTLPRQGTSGRFAWTINTAIADLATPDGVLQVADGDSITVRYDDVSPAHPSFAYAWVDARPPVITNVRVTGITNNAATIQWDTVNAPSTSKVYYSDDGITWLPVESTDLVTAHAVDLQGLTLNTLYYFDVESSDWFGQTAFDDNGGTHYSFSTVAAADVLLVIGDNTFDNVAVQGMAKYRNALSYYGWSWNEWFADPSRQGEPPLATLQQYKAVLWQTGAEQYPPFTDAQIPLIKDYLDGGGRLGVWSHDVMWAFCSDGSIAGQSDWYDAVKCAWTQGVLKSLWQDDPINPWSQVFCGSGADPICGAWTSGNPIPYTPWRSGANGDEIDALAAGGTGIPSWRANDPTPDDNSVRWTSSLNNGTMGIGVWGGRPSKLSGNWWEFSRLNYLDPNDVTRHQVLDRTIIWLIGHDHPDVTLFNPGMTLGQSYSTSPVTISWAATVYGGSSIANQDVFYSPDNGQSWFPIATVAPPTATYDWDISSIPNGCNYRIRVVVTDNGGADVPLMGAAASQYTFCINRAGGDTLGPVIWPVSLTTVPNPVARFDTFNVDATADDTLKGNSLVDAIEFFVQATMPNAGQFGFGYAMSPADGSWNSPVEAGTWTDAANFAPGWQTAWVHGRDVWNNWGPFVSKAFFVLSVAVPPGPASNVWAALSGSDVAVTWTPSSSDPANVLRYEVWAGTTYSSAMSGYAMLGFVPNGTSAFTHVGGAATGTSHYYVVRTVNLDGSTFTDSTGPQGAKVFVDLQPGRNFVSAPVSLQDWSLASVLQTVTWTAAWSYDAQSSVRPWKSFDNARGVGRLGILTIQQGLWVDATAGDLVVAGQVNPSITYDLFPGWNIVSIAQLDGTLTVGNLVAMIPVTVQRAQGFAVAAPSNLRTLVPADVLMPGTAVWLQVTGAGQYTILN